MVGRKWADAGIYRRGVFCVDYEWKDFCNWIFLLSKKRRRQENIVIGVFSKEKQFLIPRTGFEDLYGRESAKLFPVRTGGFLLKLFNAETLILAGRSNPT